MFAVGLPLGFGGFVVNCGRFCLFSLDLRDFKVYCVKVGWFVLIYFLLVFTVAVGNLLRFLCVGVCCLLLFSIATVLLVACSATCCFVVCLRVCRC